VNRLTVEHFRGKGVARCNATIREGGTLMLRAMVPCAALLLASCGSAGDKNKGDKPAPEVGYVVVQPSSVPLVTELPARTNAYQVSEVRPQVSGVIQKRMFTEGSLVRAGQPLYQIDPSLYRASAAQASANVAAAQATEAAARVKADRYKPLADMEAVSKQDYTDALSQARQAQASIAQNKAALQTAQINLRFTTVPAPITGRIGRSNVTVGALVTANQADSLATINQLDPIFVDISQSSSDLLALRRSLAQQGVVPASADVRLKLEDGSDYGLTGKVEFSEAVVDPNTGSVTLRARFPNPQGLLLPGMFVRATFAQAINTQAFLVPQAGVTRDTQGNATVWVVGADNVVVQRKVKADRTVGDNWVVTAGLNAGDRVVTQGTGKVQPNMKVKAVPADTPQNVVPPKGKGQGQGNGASKG